MESWIMANISNRSTYRDKCNSGNCNQHHYKLEQAMWSKNMVSFMQGKNVMNVPNVFKS